MIEWTEKTWNPMRGCRRVSPGCQHCYAEREAYRLASNPNRKTADKYEGLAVLRGGAPGWSGAVRFDFGTLAQAFSWRKPGMVFVNSMSDVFFEDLTDLQIAAVFGVMGATPHITYQVLTKRAVRMSDWFDWIEAESGGDSWRLCREAARALWVDAGELPPKALALNQGWPLRNVWLGVSTEDRERMDERVPLLLRVPAAVRWVSVEPLLEELGLSRWLHVDPPRLDWVVVGGESGPGARPCDIGWLQRVVDDCRAAGVPCFVKQLGASPFDGAITNPVPVKHRKGGEISEWPPALRVRAWPVVSSSPVPAPPPPPPGPRPAPPPREVVAAVGRRCTALFGREATVGWWRQAKLPVAGTPETEVLAALPAVKAFGAKAEVYAEIDVWARVLRIRGQPAEVPLYWAQMEVRTLEIKAELLRRAVIATSAEGPGVLSPSEVHALCLEERKVGEVGSGLREVRYRPGVPVSGEDVRRAFGGRYGAILLGEAMDSETGVIIYHLKLNQERT